MPRDRIFLPGSYVKVVSDKPELKPWHGMFGTVIEQYVHEPYSVLCDFDQYATVLIHPDDLERA